MSTNPIPDLAKLWWEAGAKSAKIHWPNAEPGTFEEISEGDKRFMADAAKEFLASVPAPTPAAQGEDTREAVAKELCRFSAEVSETWETTTHKDLYYGEADKILSLIHPQPSEPIGRLRVADQEKGWDGMPVRVLITNGEKNEWYFCKGHPMAQGAPPNTNGDVK